MPRHRWSALAATPRHGWTALIFGLALGLWSIQAAGASTPLQPAATWGETPTRHFVILSQPASAAAGDYYAARADGLYEALAAVFDAELATPLTLRLFPTIEDYRAANPLTAEIDGALEPGRRGRREIDIAVPAAPGSTGLDNALRRELAYRFAARLSGERLPAGLRAGIAQYLEVPDARNAAGVARLREALGQGRLYNWSALNAPGGAFADPPLTLPQNLSIIHYLAGAYGFARLVDFTRASAAAPGWRDALETAYGQPPVDLEAAWRAWLPSYLDGGWRLHALYSQDLGLAEAMLARGDYAAAARQLGGVLSLVAGSLARAERLPPWRLVEARHAAYQAAVGFAQVGNDVAAARARARVAALDRRLAPAGWALFLIGIALLVWNARRRLRDRASRPWERGPPARTSSPGQRDARRADAGQRPALPG